MNMKLKNPQRAWRASVQGLTLAVVLALGGVSPAQEPVVAPGTCRVVIVGGLPGTPVHARRFADWTKRFREYCSAKAGIPASRIKVLSGDAALRSSDCLAPASAEDVLKAVAVAGSATTPADQFVLFLAGHGDTVDGEATFALPGRDLRGGELKSALAAVPAGNQVVLHFGAASGDMISALAASNRVVVAGTAPGEMSDPVLAEFFLLFLEKAVQPPSVLEAFNASAFQTACWIRRISQSETAWRVTGKESIRFFRKLSGGPASELGARPLDPSSQPLDPDPEVSLRPVPAGAAAGGSLPKRVITEHATLEDAGHEAGVAAVGAQGYVPLKGDKEGETGYRAARVILGQAQVGK